jgi:hypothetical protein
VLSHATFLPSRNQEIAKKFSGIIKIIFSRFNSLATHAHLKRILTRPKQAKRLQQQAKASDSSSSDQSAQRPRAAAAASRQQPTANSSSWRWHLTRISLASHAHLTCLFWCQNIFLIISAKIWRNLGSFRPGQAKSLVLLCHHFWNKLDAVWRHVTEYDAAESLHVFKWVQLVMIKCQTSS